jgi:hypothetical protein
MAQIVLAQTDSPNAPSAGQTALSFPATALNQFKWVDADGGTNIIDGGGFTLTVPSPGGTAALLGTANVFTAAQRVNNSLHIRGTTDALLRIGSAVTGEVYISAANDAENAYSLIDIRASVTRVMRPANRAGGQHVHGGAGGGYACEYYVRKYFTTLQWQ